MEAAKEKALIQLAPNELHLFEHVSQRYDAKIAQGVTPEDMLVPAFWAHHAVKLRPMDEIRARAEDGTWVATLLVLDCSRTWAKVQLIQVHKLTTGDVALSQASETQIQEFIGTHLVTYRGPHKWSVVRRADKNVLAEGMEQKDTASVWLEAHARSTIGVPAAPKAEPVAA